MTPQATSPGAPAEGSVSQALGHAGRLLDARPDLARRQAEAILAAAPGHPQAQLVLAIALRRTGELTAAHRLLHELAATQPGAPAVHYELGLALAELTQVEAAVGSLRRALALKPDMADAWRALGDQLILAGDATGADQAYAESIRASVAQPELMQAAVALCDQRLDVAERLLRARLGSHPTDVAAMRMLAELGVRLGRYAEAEALLAHCLQLAPSFTGARHAYAIALFRQQKAAEALAEIERLLLVEPANPGYRNLKAAALAYVGEYGRSIDTYRALLDQNPGQPKVWLSYGHALKTAGRQPESVEAYRRAIALEPTCGEAYWSLANLKTVRFSPDDVAAMQARLDHAGLGEDDRLHLHYALGKALEDAGAYEPSFHHYAEGARIRRERIAYDADETTAQVARAKAFFSAERLQARAGQGDPAPDPIFVVGLPRSGSTLVEQILSSHSMVEGTMELAEIAAIARSLGQHRNADAPAHYPESLVELDAPGLAGLGRRFLQATAVQRKTGRPFFIDKMPNNFLHVGLIRMILPNARIIDVRRHPIATCFSGFKQHFARGQNFSYDLIDIGRYYADYIDLMSHFDRVAPGKIHRVIYEALVEDTEGEVRRLLDYCGLPFEAECLRFYENDRAVRTASSEQVRKPIFRDGVDQWRNYEQWLGPLRTTLDPLLPDFWATDRGRGTGAVEEGDGATTQS